MNASEGCGSYYDVQPNTCRHVISALIPCQSKIDSACPNPGLFKNVVAQSIGQLDSSGELTAKLDESGI